MSSWKSLGSSIYFVPILSGNPVHTYNVVKRLTIDFPNIEAELKRDDWRGKTIILTIAELPEGHTDLLTDKTERGAEVLQNK